MYTHSSIHSIYVERAKKTELKQTQGALPSYSRDWIAACFPHSHAGHAWRDIDALACRRGSRRSTSPSTFMTDDWLKLSKLCNHTWCKIMQGSYNSGVQHKKKKRRDHPTHPPACSPRLAWPIASRPFPSFPPARGFRMDSHREPAAIYFFWKAIPTEIFGGTWTQVGLLTLIN